MNSGGYFGWIAKYNIFGNITERVFIDEYDQEIKFGISRTTYTYDEKGVLNEVTSFRNDPYYIPAVPFSNTALPDSDNYIAPPPPHFPRAAPFYSNNGMQLPFPDTSSWEMAMPRDNIIIRPDVYIEPRFGDSLEPATPPYYRPVR